MTTTQADAERAREIPEHIWELARSLRDAVNWNRNSSVEIIARQLHQALSEKTAEIERVSGYYNDLCEELQAIGEDFGFMGGEPRAAAIRRVYGELKAAREAAEARLSEVERDTRIACMRAATAEILWSGDVLRPAELVCTVQDAMKRTTRTMGEKMTEALKPYLVEIAKTGKAPDDPVLRRKLRSRGLSEIVWRRNDGAIIGHGDMCLINRYWPDSEPVGEQLTPAGRAALKNQEG